MPRSPLNTDTYELPDGTEILRRLKKVNFDDEYTAEKLPPVLIEYLKRSDTRVSAYILIQELVSALEHYPNAGMPLLDAIKLEWLRRIVRELVTDRKVREQALQMLKQGYPR